VRQERPGDRDQTEDIRLELSVDLVHARGLHRPHLVRAGVVDQRVHATELRECLPGEVRGRLLVVDVEHECPHLRMPLVHR
jgi:hypothetical protein